MDERTRQRFRRTAIAVYPPHADVTAILRAEKIRVVEHLAAFEALAWARGHPFAPLVVNDPGELDRALHVVERLEATMKPRPLVVVVSNALERGLAELGWKRSTFRVGFVRTQNLADDLHAALDDLAKTEPELPAHVIDRERDIDEAADAPDFDTAALAAELRALSSWCGGVVDRVRWSYEVHAVVDDVEGVLVVSWHDALGAFFDVTLTTALPPGPSFTISPRTASFTAFAPPALEDAAFDDAFDLRPDDADALHDARAIAPTLIGAPRMLDTLHAALDRLHAHATRVARAELAATSSWLLDVWRALASQRLRGDPIVDR